jgi:large subunit ribosomal protein L25
MVRVDLTETVRVTVPIELKGTAKGAHEGGIVDEHLDHLEIECKAGEIPEVIPVSIKELGVGDAIHARDIELPEGMKLATSPETLVLTCHLVAAAKSTEELEEGMPSAPEVITEKVDQEGEDASE